MHELLLILAAFFAQDASTENAEPQESPPGEMAPAEAAEEPPRGLRLNEEGATEGYTLIAPLRGYTTYLLDMQGEVVHTWKSEHPPANHAILLPDGNLLRGARLLESPTFHAGGQGGRLQLLDWDGKILWDYRLSDEKRLHHHDIEPLANGHILVILYEAKTREEALARGRDPDHTPPEGMWPDAIFEIVPVPPDQARVVWEWRVWDHLVQDRDPEKPSYGAIGDHPELVDINADHRDGPPLNADELRAQRELLEQMQAIGYVDGPSPEEETEEGAEQQDGPPRRGPFSEADWLHTNSIDYHSALDLILLSTPNLDEIWVIDHSTTTAEAASHAGGRRGKGGDLLYRWGNPARYARGEKADQRLFAQHDATWIGGSLDRAGDGGGGGAGRIQIFNNGQRRPGGEWSEVVEITPPFDPKLGFLCQEDKPFGPAEPDWSYTAENREDFYASFISGAQRLWSGNTLVCSGPDGRVFEVTREGRIVWEYLNPYGGEAPSLATPPPHLRRPPPAEGEQPPPPGPQIPTGLFRATRIPPDHPGLKGRELPPALPR